MNELEKLVKAVAQGEMIPTLTNVSFVSYEHLEGLLDDRDGDAFSTRWLNANRRLDALISTSQLSKEETDAVTALRKEAFLQAFRQWHSDDLAGCISDDFGLIANAVTVDSDDPFINALLHEYIEGRFPTAGVSDLPGKASDQARKL